MCDRVQRHDSGGHDSPCRTVRAGRSVSPGLGSGGTDALRRLVGGEPAVACGVGERGSLLVERLLPLLGVVGTGCDHRRLGGLVARQGRIGVRAVSAVAFGWDSACRPLVLDLVAGISCSWADRSRIRREPAGQLERWRDRLLTGGRSPAVPPETGDAAEGQRERRGGRSMPDSASRSTRDGPDLTGAERRTRCGERSRTALSAATAKPAGDDATVPQPPSCRQGSCTTPGGWASPARCAHAAACSQPVPRSRQAARRPVPIRRRRA